MVVKAVRQVELSGLKYSSLGEGEERWNYDVAALSW